MNCPSCGTPLQPGARFCGVCGHKLDAPGGGNAQPRQPSSPGVPMAATVGSPAGSLGSSRGLAPAGKPAGASASRPQPVRMPAPLVAPRNAGIDPFIGTLLNNRFKVDAKLGEGGFGAVYKGTQMATGRKVAIKLLHPEMTRDENLVARFKREGLVLCNLRDAHTITTYDFDQTPDGTLYIAMELLEGRSLHQVFHDEAPIGWQRVTTVLGMMCSSLAEAHAQGIVHRDLKPENVYLEKRPNHPEFVKILDFGIAKVMRGEGSVDPHAPQLTATGQTLGTLEYMSPEQLMGKQLDGRSDIYALGVLAYELLTGRLPFPDAKGPAGLITAQLKQTPKAPSTVNTAGNIPAGVDRIIIKCLEKDKNNRFADVNTLARAVQDCVQAGGQWGTDATPAPAAPKPMAETKKGEALGNPPPAMPGLQVQAAPAQPVYQTPVPHAAAPQMPMPAPMASSPSHPRRQDMTPQPHPNPGMSAPSTEVALKASKGGSKTWIFLVVGVVAVGAIVGAILALTM